MPVPVKPPFKEIHIKIEWKDGYGQGGKTFNDAQELAAFLKDNPEFAKALKCVPKK